MWSEASDRYNTPIAKIFSANNKLRLQLQIEATLAQAQSKLGIIEDSEANEIKNATKLVTIERVKEIENEIHHDLMAMVKALSEQAGRSGEKVHLGATSNDIQDTTLALQLVTTKELLLSQLDKVSEELYLLSKRYKALPTIGRTHGQFAVPTTVGFKFANYLYELHLSKTRLKNVDVNLSKFSGAVGNYASTQRLDVEKLILENLGLKVIEISTQVISRVIHADFMNALALNAAVLERLSKEIRNLQRSEINEWKEPFSRKQVGSSAMPHKRNPHKSERISGLARIIRSNVNVSLENISLEHERDISHSSVERIIIPESANLLYYISNQMYLILKDIEINEASIENNLKKASGVSTSEQILKLLVDKIGRQQGHEILRSHVLSENYEASIMMDEKIVSILGKEQLEAIFSNVNIGLSIDKTDKLLKLYSNDWISV